MSILTLPPEVVDQIAAGEVVERPSHMVKELIENSLDAGATEVELDFDQGGRWVRVKDNGNGIAKEELALAVARHATSKIATSADIWHIHSYGFRGEALATIGAVSHLHLVSRTKSQSQAAWLKMEFGVVSETLDQGGEFGTTITVSELFNNVPARLKFLKSEAAETTSIKHVVKGLSLANPQVTFRLKQKGKLVEHWPGQTTFLERAEQILGLSPLFFGVGQDGEIKAEVAIAPPQVRERNSRQIWTLVQNRLVQDRSLQAAVTEAYRHLMMHGDFPVAVVSVSCPPEIVDINIHPTKSAVKFQQPSQAFRAVHRAVRSILETAPWLQAEKDVALSPLPPPEVDGLLMSSTIPMEEKEISRVQYPRLHSFSSARQVHDPVIEKPPAFPYAELKSMVSEKKPADLQSPGVEEKTEFRWQRLQVLGQAHLTYILAQDEKALVLIDQHAAHERVAFERLMRGWQGEGIEIQQFLLPLTLHLEAELVEALLQTTVDLQRLGIEIEASGPTSVLVRAAPALLKEAALAEALTQLAHEVEQLGGSFAAEKAVGHLCATLACHSVVRAGQALSVEQMQSLLLQMDEFPLSSFCPHGRPVSVTFPWTQLEREFGRLV